ncbi:MAG: VacJ family lipoprotein [Rickettsia sp.]|nr:VacJ family lipoprotein [Rickettsia sp.]
MTGIKFLVAFCFLIFPFISLGKDSNESEKEKQNTFFEEYFSSSKEKYNQITEQGLLKWNYSMFLFNMFFDKKIFLPASFIYEVSASSYFKERLNDFLDNINTPYFFVNNIAQKKIEASLCSFWRFAINSTLGIFGIFDVASLFDIKPQPQTFGDTLEFYGYPKGEYIILPLIGGVYSRDIFSVIGHIFFNPLKIYLSNYLIFNSLDLLRLKHQNLFALHYLYKYSLTPFYQYQNTVILGKK